MESNAGRKITKYSIGWLIVSFIGAVFLIYLKDKHETLFPYLSLPPLAYIIFSFLISIFLSIAYIIYNKKKNKVNKVDFTINQYLPILFISLCPFETALGYILSSFIYLFEYLQTQNEKQVLSKLKLKGLKIGIFAFVIHILMIMYIRSKY